MKKKMTSVAMQWAETRDRRMNAICRMLIPALLLIACNKEIDQEDKGKRIIENETFNTTLLIDGAEYDGAIIRNCIFENINGDGLQIRDVKELCVENCVFRDISQDAIRFRNSGGSDGVKIQDNEIYNIGENGILASDGHLNTIIHGNVIYHVATDYLSAQFGAPHHGIYFQGANVTITGNTVHTVENDQGNCISIRTYGTIARNKLYGATDHGISYFSDNPGLSELLLIENNLIYDNGKRAVNLASNGDSDNHIGRALIRFNTLVTDSVSTIGINALLDDASIEIQGNIAVRTDGGTTYVFAEVPYIEDRNITAAGDPGFVDFDRRDLRLTPNSAAVNAATGLTDFPLTDYAGNPRSLSGLDAGAFEL